MMRRRTLVILPALALVLATASACGGGGKSASSTEAKSDQPAAGGSTNADDAGQIGDAASAADSGGGKGSGGSSGGSASGSGGSGGLSVPSGTGGKPGDVGSAIASDFKFTGTGSGTFCKEMKALQSSYATAGDPNPSFAGMAAKVAKIAPPPELEADWPTFVKVQESLANAPQGGGAGTLDQATMVKFSAASDKVAAYLTNVCGI